MATTDIQGWLGNREMFARRVASTEVLGLLKRSWQVPANTIAAVNTDGTRRVARGGEQLTGRFDAVLIKTQEMPVYFSVAGLRSKDAFGITSGVRLTLQLESFEPDRVDDFCRNFTAASAQTSADDLRDYLALEVKRALSEYIGGHDAADLQNSATTNEVEGGLRRALEGPLFGKGLTFRKLMELEFQSESFDREREDRRKEREKVRDHEAVLLDQQRREEKLKRLAQLMKSEDAQLVFKEITDDRTKGLLYAKLMENDLADLSSEEIRAKLQQWGDDLVGVVLRAYSALADAPDGNVVEPVRPEKLARIIVTAGSRVLMFSPANPVESCKLVEAGFNLRAARIHEWQGRKLLFAGGKRQIAAIDPENAQVVAPYPLPDNKKPKGGVNATAVWKEKLFGSHSEVGLLRWDLSKPGVAGEAIYSDLTALATTVRAVTVTPEGMLYFAAGRTVYQVDLNVPDAKPLALQPHTPSGVTALAVGTRLLAGGCGSGSDGALVLWDRKDPLHALSVLRRNASIGSTRFASIGGVAHILFTCRDHGVTARVIGQALETHFDSGEQTIVLAEGGCDFVAGVDHNGRYLVIWDSARPGKPRSVVDLSRYTDQAVYDVTAVFEQEKP